MKHRNLSIQKLKLTLQRAQTHGRFMFTCFKTSILTCQSPGEIRKARKACAEVAAAVAAAAAGVGLPD